VIPELYFCLVTQCVSGRRDRRYPVESRAVRASD
jgi:hypothetical protein